METFASSTNRIIFVTNRFGREDTSWLTNDLADGFAACGYSVDVVCLDWEQRYPEETLEISPRIRLYNYNYIIPKVFSKIPWVGLFLKWFLFSWSVRKKIPKSFYSAPSPQLIITFSPVVTIWALVSYFGTKFQCKKLNVMWDFFPIHHFEIGKLPKLLVPILKSFERSLLQNHNLIGCMSPKNLTFLTSYFSLSKSVKSFVLPLWGPSEELVASYDSHPLLDEAPHAVTCIFGGQLSAGRGLDTIVALAEISQNADMNVRYLVAGRGPLLSWLRDEISKRGLKNIDYLGALSRTKYLDLLQRCSIGLVLTNPNVSVPTFPSKSIDYFRAGIPILAAIEKSTDYGFILENTIEAGMAADGHDIQGLFRKLQILASDRALREKLGRNGRVYYSENMTAKRAAELILRNSFIGRKILSEK